MPNKVVTLIPGDGIGPEIAASIVKIFEAAEVPITWEYADAGLVANEKYGTPLPDSTMESIRKNRIALKGPTTTPVGGGHKSVNVTIRKSLDLYANVRPARTLPNVKTPFENIDLLLVRENVEDTYGGIEHFQSPDYAQCLKVITRPGSETVFRYAFEAAVQLNRKKITCVHKANIHKITDGLFLEVFYDVAKEYPQIEANDIIVDNCCMQLVTKPENFDVLVLPNLYGDIVSDLCAGLVGGLGVAPGGNIGHHQAVFEAVHGSAPDIAGKNMANPTALLLSSIQMLRFLGLFHAADRIEKALRLTLSSGIKTRDLGGNATTDEFTRALVSELPPKTKDEEFVEPPDTKSKIAVATKGTWECVGVDMFIQSETLPTMPQSVGNLDLTMMSNRGTKVYPGPTPDILIVDVHRCRYIPKNGIVTNDDIIKLMQTLEENSIKWMHVEKLHNFNGKSMYSKAQGE